MNKTNIIGAIAIIALIIGLLSLVLKGNKTTTVATTSFGSTVGNTQLPTGPILPNPSTFDYVLTRVAQEFDGPIGFYGLTNSTGLLEVGSTTACVTGTSTIAAIKNPFQATSTLAFLSINGTEGATTSDILIATSTTIAPATPVTATSTLGANIANLAAVATTSTFFSVAGLTMGPGKGYANPKGIASSNSQSVVVGPSEYVIAFSTSTSGQTGAGLNGGTGATQVATPSSCTIKTLWRL